MTRTAGRETAVRGSGFALGNGGRVFRHRAYRLFFGGQLVSLVGTWMQNVAQGWLVLQLSNDPLWLGIVSALQFLPVMFFGLFGGIVADGLPKRRTLIVTQTVGMVLALVLGVLTATHTVQVWHILILAVLLGTTNAVDMPTRQAFAVEMVGRRTSRTPSRSTRRCSTSRASSVPRSPASRSAPSTSASRSWSTA